MIIMVPTENKTSYSAVQIPSDLLELLDGFAKTPQAKKLGITNKSQAAKKAALEFLEKYSQTEEKPTRFILPNLEDPEESLDLDIYEKTVICNKCSLDSCRHTDTLYKDKYVKMVLINSKIKIPKIK